MKYVNFPGTEEKVSVLGLGTWVFGAENWGGADEQQSFLAVEKAMELGVNFIDTAPFYGNGLAEKIVGRAIKKCRDKAFIATKCGLIREGGWVSHNLSPESISREIELSRQRLLVDEVDLYLCHWPDPAVAIEDTVEALLKLQKQKKVRHLGVCNFDLNLLKKALRVGPIKVLQVQYSLLERETEKELLPFCLEKGIGVMAYGVMGGGILTGKYLEKPQLAKKDARRMFYAFYQGEKFEKSQKLIHRLQGLGHPLNQLALNWVRQQPGIMTALAGCRNVAQVAENFGAIDWDLSSDELERIGELEKF
ncbi:MAG: aldo/keto reductase [Candidatus Omnitrophica bacterium]|nr:aldo/keto reductase [Candidatus Omnitrophota bacterium]